ncbi:MAG: hypothetical protein NVSMB23_05580 [Myxococcales bacterium]
MWIRGRRVGRVLRRKRIGTGKVGLLVAVAAGAILASGCGGALAPGDVAGDARPDGRFPVRAAVAASRALAQAGPSSSAQRPVRYHGGPVLRGTVGVYFIWYGAWPEGGAREILPDLVRGLSGSGYLRLQEGFRDASAGGAGSQVVLRGSTFDRYSQGKVLSDASVASSVTRAIVARELPLDPDALYFVLSSADVSETSGFCSSYCGFHEHTRILGETVRFAFVGNASGCMSACAAQPAGPNGDAAADAMASIVAHELSEAITDPDFDAWYDSDGSENGDKCAWTFGATHAAPNGAQANVVLGDRHFLLQQLWSTSRGGACALE